MDCVVIQIMAQFPFFKDMGSHNNQRDNDILFK